MSKILLIFSLISFTVSAVFFFIGGGEVLLRPEVRVSHTYAIWCVFFLLLGIVTFLIDISIHKVCSDVAELLKEIEDKKTA